MLSARSIWVASQLLHSHTAPCFIEIKQVGGHAALPSALDGEDHDDEDQVRVSGRRTHRDKKGRNPAKGRDWIMKKKALRRARGYEDVKPDTKYTGRKRKDRF